MSAGNAPLNDARLRDLFDQALQVEPEDLDRWLDDVCRDDVPLRAALQGLLRADAAAADFMESPPSMVQRAGAGERAAPTQAAGAGDMPDAFGVYRVVRSIGVGGMGEVWLAQRADGEFEQRVAIKQLAYPTPGLMQRFRQERQILARLEHPNIARLIDGGLDASGSPYLVMEFVEGQPITRYAQAKALDLRSRLELFLRVCEAVQYAHQNLIVHRDLKPANIFVTTEGTPKLLDFGIAKVLESSDAQTQTAARLLTPDYAAPEQFSGGAITTATDVYALGVVLYELLAARRPPRATAQFSDATPRDDVSTPPPSAALQVSSTNPITRRALLGDLDRIALTALAADPQRRYPSAEALGSDIRLYLQGRPISARRDSFGYRFGKYARRNRYLLGAALIVLIVSLAATVVSVRQARLAHDEAQRASAVRQFLVGVFHEADPDENKGQPISARQLLEKGERQIEPRLKNQPALEADVTTLLGQLYVYLGDEAHGDALLTRALAISEKGDVPDDVRARVLINMAAIEAEIKAKFDASLAHARAGMALIDHAPNHPDEDVATAHYVIGLDLIKLGREDEAIAQLSVTARADQAQLGDRSESVAEEWVKLGKALGETNRYAEADAAFQKALTIVTNIYGENSNRVGHVLDEMAAMYCDQGDCSHAESVERRALQIRLDTLGAEHPDTLNVRHKLLLYIELQGRYVEALPQRLELAEQIKASKGINPLKISVEYDALGIDYRELGQFAKAASITEQALALIDSSQGPGSLRSLNARIDYASILQLQGRYADADAVTNAALKIAQDHGATPTSYSSCVLRQKIGQNLRLEHSPAQAVRQLAALRADACITGLPENDPWRAQLLADLSQAQLDSGAIAAAMETAEAALSYARKSLPAHHYKLAAAVFALARVDLAAQKPAEAESLLREALALRSPPHPPDDPRVLELDVALANALDAQGKHAESEDVIAKIEPLLKASATPYAADLRARLAMH